MTILTKQPTSIFEFQKKWNSKLKFKNLLRCTTGSLGS